MKNLDLINALNRSDRVKAAALLEQALDRGENPWDIHLALFPAVHRVLNPYFINPHMAKMYAVNREFLPYLKTRDIPDLVRLEIGEYAVREKLDRLPKPPVLPSIVSFKDIETSIGKRDWAETASKMAAYITAAGPEAFARKMLLLGSGYLDRSLGHSISCTAFILLEMMRRTDQDPWPVIALLADYFCKGRFKKTPDLHAAGTFSKKDEYLEVIKKSVSGTGIVALHHIITLYAIERVRHLLRHEEYEHMLAMANDFIGDKAWEPVGVESDPDQAFKDFSSFFYVFSRLETIPMLSRTMGLTHSGSSRKTLGRYWIKGVCQLYQGHYDPHYLTGLGSVLWVMDRFHDRTDIMAAAMHQYLDFFFSGIRA